MQHLFQEHAEDDFARLLVVPILERVERREIWRDGAVLDLYSLLQVLAQVFNRGDGHRYAVSFIN
jgi:hypothetical protein